MHWMAQRPRRRENVRRQRSQDMVHACTGGTYVRTYVGERYRVRYAMAPDYIKPVPMWFVTESGSQILLVMKFEDLRYIFLVIWDLDSYLKQ